MTNQAGPSDWKYYHPIPANIPLILMPIMRKKEYSFQYSKWLILSGLHLYLSTLLDTNNETNRVLFPILKKVDVELCSLLSKYSF